MIGTMHPEPTPVRYRRWPVRVRLVRRLRHRPTQHGIFERWDGDVRVCTRCVNVGPVVLLFGEGRS